MARLLIIEDGVPLASLLVSATSARGHLTTAAHCGRDGLELAREEPFALAIVDLLLPDLRGAEVLEALRAMRVPCIAMSGVFKGDRFATDAVERHGALAFFEKPFDLQALLDAIDGVVGAQPGVSAFEVQDDEGSALEDLDIDVEDEESGVLELQHGDIVEDEVTPRTALPYLPAESDAGGLAPQEGVATRELPVPAAILDAEVSFADVLDDARAPGDAGATWGGDASSPARPPASPEATLDVAVGSDALSTAAAKSVDTPVVHRDDVSFDGRLAIDDTAPGSDEGAFEEPAADLAAPGDDDASFDGLLAADDATPGNDDASFDGLLAAFDPDRAVGEAVGAPDATSSSVDASTPFSNRGQVWAVPKPSARRARASRAPELGRLEHRALIGLLNACHQSRFTGSLELSTDGDDLSLRFHAGRAVGAATSRPEGSFTRFCLEQGAIPPTQLESLEVLAESESLSQDEAFARLLQEQPLLEPQAQARLHLAHLEALVARALTWEGGTSRLVAKERPPADAPSTSLSVPELVFAASLATADLGALRETLPDTTRLTPTADPPYELGELPLSDAQAYVLAHTDGSKTISDILVLAELDERELLVTLQVMVQLGILESRTPSRSSRRITFGL